MPSSPRSVDYKNPPVVETAFAFVFAPIKSWNLLHFGLLWNRYRDEYPVPEVKLPTGSFQLNQINLRLSPDMDLRELPLRCWFVDQTKHHLLQVQSNCFIRNWRKIEEPLAYVHYDEMKPLFEKDWAKFNKFLADESLEPPQVWQTEVSYINHLVRGNDWNSLGDLPQIYPFWQRELTKLAAWELNSFSYGTTLPNGGKVQVAVQPALRPDGKQILQHTITVIDIPQSSDHKGLMASLDRAHDTLVAHFDEMTSPLAQQKWEKI